MQVVVRSLCKPGARIVVHMVSFAMVRLPQLVSGMLSQKLVMVVAYELVEYVGFVHDFLELLQDGVLAWV